MGIVSVQGSGQSVTSSVTVFFVSGQYSSAQPPSS